MSCIHQHFGKRRSPPSTLTQRPASTRVLCGDGMAARRGGDAVVGVMKKINTLEEWEKKVVVVFFVLFVRDVITPPPGTWLGCVFVGEEEDGVNARGGGATSWSSQHNQQMAAGREGGHSRNVGGGDVVPIYLDLVATSCPPSLLH